MDKQEQERSDGTVSDIALYTGDTEYGRIKFQCGPIKEVGVNGTTIENVLEALKHRLECFQKGSFRCRTNAKAITKIEEAIMWLEERTKKILNKAIT